MSFKTAVSAFVLLTSAVSAHAERDPRLRPLPPPPPPERHECSIISGTIGLVRGILSAIGLCEGDRAETVVVVDDMPYVRPSDEILPRVSPSSVTTVETTEENGKRTRVTTTVRTDSDSAIVWVEGYFVERKMGNYVESTFVPGHWENRKRK